MKRKTKDGARSLNEIALELLGKYEEAKTTVIYEYSCHIDEDLKRISEKCKKYRDEIERAAE